MTRQEAENYLSKVAAEIGEHFDCAQVMVSWNEEGNTHALYRGAGNWYARQGLAREFIELDAAQTNAREIYDAIQRDTDGDDGDDWKTAGDF